MPNLFAHGLLRSGRPDNGRISGAELLGPGLTAQEYALIILNKKPIVTKRPVSRIKGEVYSVTDEMLALIDRLEAHPRVNKRELVQVRLENGDTVEAWLYFYIQPLRESVIVESGDYSSVTP